MPDIADLRILEIGPPYVKRIFPHQTVCFSPEPPADLRKNEINVITFATLPALYRTIRADNLSLIVCRPSFYSPWQWQWIVRVLFNWRFPRGNSIAGAFGPQTLRLKTKTPIAILDSEDIPFVNRNNFFLLSRCRAYFKRELPVDRWRIFMKTAHANLPTPRFRRQPRYREWIDKVRPLPLGLPLGSMDMLPMQSEKVTDVFFAGNVEANSTVRQTGIRELMTLRDKGIQVDIPESRLSPQEFYQRAAAAWLVWSPEGLGWDCFRHYEALACGSIPIINQPTIERHMPLLAGEHAYYYDPEPGSLTKAIFTALADKDRLRVMAQSGKAHVLKYHTPEAIANYVIQTTLG